MIIIIKITSYTDKSIFENYIEKKNSGNINNFFQINIISRGGGEWGKYYENI